MDLAFPGYVCYIYILQDRTCSEVYDIGDINGILQLQHMIYPHTSQSSMKGTGRGRTDTTQSLPSGGPGLVWSKKGRKRVGKGGENEGGEMKRKEKERELGISMDIETGLDCTVTKIS